MKVTNLNNLPEPLVRAVTRHPRRRDSNVISVTELIQPPQLRALALKHENEIVEDASDRIWALLGTLLHGVLERNAKGLEDTISEEELEIDVLGWRVIGHYDLSEIVLDGELLTDWKLTSVWAVKDGIKPEWEAQLNVYAELIRRAGRYVNQLQIVTIGRDWSKSKAQFDQSYPQQQVQTFSVPLWSSEQATDYLEERVRLHQNAEQGIYPDCTPQERWERETQWALMKRGQKKAVKLYLNSDLALQAAGEAKDLSVVERRGASVRCESYCPVSRFCKQYEKLKPTLINQLAASLEQVKKDKAA
jgi:hypothetical protein